MAGIKNVLDKLLNYIISNFGNEKSLSSLKGCCCKEPVFLIDFDEVTTKLCEKNQLQTMKSCDGLKIIPNDENYIFDLVEFKGWKLFFDYQKELTLEQIENKIANYELSVKLNDSLVVLYTLLQNKKLSIDTEQRNVYFSLQKKFIVVSDTDKIEPNKMFLVSSFVAAVKEKVKNKLNEIPTEYGNHRIICEFKTCGQFYEYAKKHYN